MTRKSKQSVDRELARRGARLICWDHGQKHEIATVELDDGRRFEMGFSRGDTWTKPR